MSIRVGEARTIDLFNGYMKYLKELKAKIRNVNKEMMKRYCLYLFILIGISCSAELKAQKMELFTKGMILPCDIPAERWFPPMVR